MVLSSRICRLKKIMGIYDGDEEKNSGTVNVEGEMKTWILCKAMPQYIL